MESNQDHADRIVPRARRNLIPEFSISTPSPGDIQTESGTKNLGDAISFPYEASHSLAQPWTDPVPQSFFDQTATLDGVDVQTNAWYQNHVVNRQLGSFSSIPPMSYPSFLGQGPTQLLTVIFMICTPNCTLSLQYNHSA
jgi:hypothetical protein